MATSSPVTHKTTDSFISLSGGPLEVGSYVLSEEKVEGVALGEEAYLTVFGRAVVETINSEKKTRQNKNHYEFKWS